MTNLPEISHLTIAELMELSVKADALIAIKKEAGLAELRARFEEQAATFGLTAVAVVNGAPKKVRKPRTAPNEE